MFRNLSKGGGTLDAQGGFIIAPLYIFTRMGKDEHPVSLYQMIQVGSTVFRTVLIGKNNEMNTLETAFFHCEPAGRERQTGAENIRS